MRTNNITTEQMKEAINKLNDLDPRRIVADFLAFDHSCPCGTYCAAVLTPLTGEVDFIHAASRSCSANEYFGEDGVLSRMTILSSTRAYWAPSPDEGFEWEDGEDYVHPAGDYSGWITSEDFADLEAEDQAKYTEWFAVSNTPIDGWGDPEMAEEVEKTIETLIEELRGEIEEEDEEEEEEEDEETSGGLCG